MVTLKMWMVCVTGDRKFQGFSISCCFGVKGKLRRKKASLGWDGEYFFKAKWEWRFLEQKLGVIRYIFEQPGAAIGDGIFS